MDAMASHISKWVQENKSFKRITNFLITEAMS